MTPAFRLGIRIAVLAGAIALAAPPTIAAQPAPIDPLTRAIEHYAAGAFHDALASIEEGLKGRDLPFDDRVTLLTWKVRILVALDETEQAKNAAKSLLGLEPNFPARRGDDPPGFILALERARREIAELDISSVSKMGETLLEAPATVVVIRAEDIKRRGYLDLEAVLHDLPGFDIARTNGQTYANVYQRGYRSDVTNRTLLLIDGVEQNELFSNVAHITRQYPLSSIDRIEVIYGPASTIYGPNAFLGVINVITKAPEALLQQGRTFGWDVQVGGGSWGSSYVEGIFAGRLRGLTVSVTGRVFKSDEWDLSQHADWDYSLTPYRNAASYWRPDGLFAGMSGPLAESRPDLASTAMALDQAGFGGPVGGIPVGYSDLTDDWFVGVAIKAGSLSLGFQTWSLSEGSASWGTDRARPGARNGSRWEPYHTALHATYKGSLSSKLTFTYFGQAKVQGLGTQSSAFSYRSYLDGPLDVRNAIDGERPFWTHTLLTETSNQFRNELDFVLRPSEKLAIVAGVEVRNGSVEGDYTSKTNCHTLTSQIGNFMVANFGGAQLADTISRRPDMLTELENRLLVLSGRAPRVNLQNCLRATGAAFPPPAPTPDDTAGGEHFAVVDLGAFAQLTYKITSRLRGVLGVRGDRNRVMPNGGFGGVGSPRVAAVYALPWATVKGVYSQAFKDSASSERYSRVPGIRGLSNPFLQPERARNLEFSIGREWTSGLADISYYQSRYTHVIRTVQPPVFPEVAALSREYLDRFPRTVEAPDAVPSAEKALFLREALDGRPIDFLNQLLGDPLGTSQLQNVGGVRTRGLQAVASWRVAGGEVFGNYSYTRSRPTDDSGVFVGQMRTADIARHRLNLGITGRLRIVDGSLRVNYVGSRPTGVGTTAPLSNVQGTPLTEIPAYTVAHASAGVDLRRGFSLQVLVNNIFDAEYFDPGVGAVDGVNFAARIPQPGRSVFARVLHRF